MIEKVDEPISVATIYSAEKRRTVPWILGWHNRRLKVTEVGFHHYYKDGKRLIHVFEVVADSNMHMRLSYDTQSLNWTLEAISDGQAE